MDINSYTLEDMHQGRTESFSVEIAPDDVDKFTRISGDYSPIHTDEAYAAERGFDGRLTHGLFIGALVSRLIGNQLPGMYGIIQSIELGFRKPLIAPATVTIEGSVEKSSASTGQVKIAVKAMDVDGAVLASGNVKVIVRP